ncbi:helix-turn-helix domain-containing protein [Corallococcus exercitus]|uniref:helix-turn-helix domain-containing protein n=1 Tax=Corallococcus exercitus TaxID=2316736 RepID=UPI0035D4B335
MRLALIDEALEKGVRLEAVCERLGVAPRTIQRWRKPETAQDGRCGPRTQPANPPVSGKLSPRHERARHPQRAPRASSWKPRG